MQAADGEHGFLCVVNPTNRAIITDAYYTPLWRGRDAATRERAGPVHFNGQGACLLPLSAPIAGGYLYHSSWELTSNEAASTNPTPGTVIRDIGTATRGISRRHASGTAARGIGHRHASIARLTFSAPVSGTGEIAFSSRMKLLSCKGGLVKGVIEEPWGLMVSISVRSPSIHVELEADD